MIRALIMVERDWSEADMNSNSSWDDITEERLCNLEKNTGSGHWREKREAVEGEYGDDQLKCEEKRETKVNINSKLCCQAGYTEAGASVLRLVMKTGKFWPWLVWRMRKRTSRGIWSNDREKYPSKREEQRKREPRDLFTWKRLLKHEIVEQICK